MTHVHLIGIGGSGLSAIARLLLQRGEQVSGSDRQFSPSLPALEAAGSRLTIGHAPENVRGAQVVVRSSAVADDNVEVQAALAAGVPVLKRAEFLSQFLTEYRVIAVAGTHGKTTTTAMIAWMLSALGKDPSYIIGSTSLNLGDNAHAGASDLFVIEADEYDRMFLGLSPYIAVVTNVEHDHPDCYPTAETFWQAFHEFAGRVQPNGVLLACRDDAGARRLLLQAVAEGVATRSYGLDQPASLDLPGYYAAQIEKNAHGGFSFDVLSGNGRLSKPAETTRVNLQVPGRHNVLNALATMGVAHLLDLPLADAAAALGDYRGAGRRFEVRGEAHGVLVIDDYAHHPTEIQATLAAARSRYPHRRLWAVWQPHTYSRVRALFADFVHAFADADAVLVTEIYAARESPPADGFSAAQVAKAMAGKNVSFIPALSQAADFLVEQLRPGDVLVVMSAGDADRISTSVLERLGKGERS